MKLTKVENPASGSPVTYNPENMTIQNNFADWYIIPDTYTKVAEYYSATTNPSTTDFILGAKLETTYATYISGTQPADTYSGQVKYTLVHPYTEESLQPRTTSSGQICYYPNANSTEGTMGCQVIGTSDNTTSTSAMLLAGNFSRTGYGFAGWSDKFDYETNAEAHFFGPQQNISFEEGQYSGDNPGLSLYAVWVKSAGSLQDSSKVTQLCGTSPSTGTLVTTPTDSTANLSSVTALTDQRDSQTYAIARLADGKCWMIENLRLESTNSDNSTGALAQGYGTSTTYGNFSGLATAEPAWASNNSTANSLYSTDGSNNTINIGTSNASYRFPRYNNTNTSTRASNPAPTTNSMAMYSYGNYYTWAAAIADTTAYTTNNQSVTNTSLCPTGWHLPTGGGAYASDSTIEVNKTSSPSTYREFYNLGYKIMNEVKTAYEDTPNGRYSYYSSNTTNTASDTAAKAFRKYPNNFVYSGFVLSSSVSARGSCGSYWSSTTDSSNVAYSLYLNSSFVYPGTRNYYYKYNGWSIRCVAPGT